MDWNKEELVVKIINRENDVKELILHILKEKDYSFLMSLIKSLEELAKDKMVNKEIIVNIEQLIAWNLDEPSIFDNEMNLKNDFKFLKDYTNILLKNITKNEDTTFTPKQLAKVSDENLVFMLPESSEVYIKETNLVAILNELSSRIRETKLNFSLLSSEETKKYLNFAHNYLYKEELARLIEDDEFLSTFDSNNISVEKLLEWTENCLNPRFKLLQTKKVKKALLVAPEKISDNLSKEEVLLTWNDINIKNIFITKGLRFDCLDQQSQQILLEDTDTFKVYNLKTIDEFIKGYENITFLAQNLEFIFVYLNKITKDNINYKNPSLLLNNLNELIIEELLDDSRIDSLSKEAILYLITSLKSDYITLLLENKKIYNVIKDNKSLYPFMNLPSNIQIEILINKDYLFKDPKIRKLFYNSKKSVIKEVLTRKKSFVEEFISLLIESEKSFDSSEIELVMTSFSKEQFSDFINNQLSKLNGTSIIYLLNTNPDLFKRIILDNEKISKKVLESINEKNVKEFNNWLSQLNDNEKISLITKDNDISNIYSLINVINNITEKHKRELYNNKKIRNKILKASDKHYIIDEYTTEYLLANSEEIIELNPEPLCEFLKNIKENQLKRILTNDEIILKILKNNSPKSSELIISLINKHNVLLNYLNKPIFSKFIPHNLFSEIIDNLNLEEKNAFCSNVDILNIVFNNNREIYKVYKGLLDKNRYLLDTLVFQFLNEDTILLKFSTLEYLTKNKKFQQLYLKITKKVKISRKLLTTLLNITQYFNCDDELTKIFEVICDSVYGNNRKRVGNFKKVLSEVDFDNISNNDFNNLVTYLLYLIPKYQNNEGEIARATKIIEVPSSFDEMINYEKNLQMRINSLLVDCQISDYKNYFFIKHYKMTLEEIEYFISCYNLDKIDEKVYKDEVKFIKKIIDLYEKDSLDLKEITDKEKVYSLIEIYNIEKKIKEMYSKIYNYELKLCTKSLKPTTLKLYGKNITLYEPKEKFIFLINSIPIESFTNLKNNDYFEAWNNYINDNSRHIVTNLISNDNLSINIHENLIVGFDSLGNNTIKKMAPYSLKSYNVQRFMSPRTLINNTRESCNNIILSKYEDRPNYLNSNNPNITPDYIIIFKDLLFENELQNNSYLEKNYRASLDFKNKNHPKGLPLILIDRERILTSELNNLNESINKYIKNNSVTLFSKCLNKFENNKCGFILSHSKLADEFNEEIIITPLMNRITSTNSIAELEYIKDIIENEKDKYTHPELLKVAYQKINFDNILTLIEKSKIKVLSKQSK